MSSLNRKLKKGLAAGLCVLTLTAAQPVLAQSLWSDDAANGSMGIFSDRKARNVGDIVTIVIDETTTTSTSKSNSNSKSGNQNLNAGVGIFHFLALATASGSDAFNAKGAANATNSVHGRVTVTVVEVQPNGNMVVEGKQSIWQNKDEHRITLRGVIRRDDVAADNTVPSTQVADATLRFDGKGPLNAKQRQGILTQIFNILF